MKKLSISGLRWLKCIHLVSVCLWVGGGLALTLLTNVLSARSGGELLGATSGMKLIDDLIIVPGALGCLFTGIVYAVWTKWGWFKHRWVIIKWVVTVTGILFGTFALGPWINTLPPLAEAHGLDALSMPEWEHAMISNRIGGAVQVATLLFAVFISVLKPWKKTNTNINAPT